MVCRPGLRRTAAVVRGGLAGAALALLAAPIPGLAQDSVRTVEPDVNEVEQRLDAVDKNKPMLLQADELIYDNRRNRVIADGNVEIYFNNYTLTADSVVYDRSNNTLSARGNVRIKEPDGAVIQADEISLTDDFREGFINSLKAVTQDDWRIAALKATRQGGNVTVFENAVATPCKACKDNPKKAPTWRVKAMKVIHDKDARTISYENATFELFGVPVAWVPYFSHPDPTVKRKSGFLVPKVGQSGRLGFFAETPYFFNLAPNYDFTFSPLFTSKQGVLAKGEWRHRLRNGAYNVQLAGIYQADPIRDTDPGSDLPGDTRFRGSIKTVGKFAIDSVWNWGWDITADTDDTFRRAYRLDNIRQTDRVSKVFLEGVGERSYFSMKGYQFGGLLLTESTLADSRVHPVIDLNYIFADPVVGGELSFNVNAYSITRSENNAATHRAVAELAWRKTLVDPLGQTYTPFLAGRGDVYEMRNVTDPVTGEVRANSSRTRAVGVAGLEYRYPFVAHGRLASHVFEPIGQIFTRNSLDSQTLLANEDAQSLVFDDTLLFDRDKFSGYDRVETGTRVNAGVQYTMNFFSGGFIRAVAGRSFHIAGQNSFPTASGLDTQRSDYVGGLYFAPNQNLSLLAQGRFDSKRFDLVRADLAARAKYGPFSGSVNYARQQAEPALGFDTKREEISANTTIRLASNWYTFGALRYDLAENRTLSDTLGIKYADECYVLSVSYNQSFFQDRDIDPDESILFRFELKHLGGVDIKTDVIGN